MELAVRVLSMDFFLRYHGERHRWRGAGSSLGGKHQMNKLLLWFGRAAGLAGMLVCAVAAAVRLSGQYFLGGFQVTTLLQVGMASMIAGCLFLLVVLTERSK